MHKYQIIKLPSTITNTMLRRRAGKIKTMMNIQKKSLQHISEVLKSVDSYPVYSTLIDAMRKAGIENNIGKEVSDKFQLAMSEQMQKVRSAKDWVDTLISDEE